MFELELVFLEVSLVTDYNKVTGAIWGMEYEIIIAEVCKSKARLLGAPYRVLISAAGETRNFGSPYL